MRLRPRLTALLREPLLHFVVIGAALFAASALRGGGPGGGGNRIFVSAARQEQLAAGFARTWRRPPADEELRGLVDEWIREEIASREAIAMGLGEDDAIIRRRLRQKLEFISEDLSGAEPDEAALQSWLEAHPEAYRQEPRVALRQVFVNADRRGARAPADAAALLSRLLAGAHPAALGDPTLAPAALPLSPRSEVARLFGEPFADAVLALEPGRWVGPVRSGFGLHLVLLEAREPGRTPALAEVRDAVRRDLLFERQRQAKDDLYRALAARYRIEIEAPPAAPAAAERGAAGGGSRAEQVSRAP
jgi:hypothetical protein